MKPDMGIIIVRSNTSSKCLIATTNNLKSYINRVRFQLKSGGHPNRELQKDWKEKGEDSFTIEVLEKLKYDKDEGKTDYSVELEVMQMIWEEKLQKEGMEFY